MRVSDKAWKSLKMDVIKYIVACKENIKACEMFNQKADEFFIKLRCYEKFLKQLQNLEAKALPEDAQDKKKGGKE